MMISPVPLPAEHAAPAEPGDVKVRLRLIGRMEAWSLTSDSVLPTGRKTRALLAIVALSAPRPVLRSRLAELLWSRRPEEQARASLRQEIHRLLDALSHAGVEVLAVNRDHLALQPGVVWVDAGEVLRATPANAAALSLLESDLLEELDGVDPAFDAWLVTERERLRDRARGVAEALLREQVTPETAITVAQQLLTIDRAHEGAWRALMRGHAERGERGMAVQAYERCRASLADMLDAQPSPETQRLLSEIRAGRTGPAEPVAGREPVRSEARTGMSRGGAKVGVLPLQMVGTGEEESHLSSGLAEEITSALARFRWMFLVSHASLAQFVAGTRDETEIRRTFGIDFLLDGSVQRIQRRLRITLRLVDLRDGNQVVWARRFDRPMHDLLSLQDEIAAEVVAQIDPEILLIEGRRAARRPPADASAYELVLRALPLIARLQRREYGEAGRLLEQAIEKEPDYAAAHAWLAYWHVFYVGQGWADDPEAAFERAGQLADRAITLDPQDARALTIAGHVRSFLHHKLREGLALHDRALALNPNLAMAWALSAMTACWLGQQDDAAQRFARYKHLSPMDPHAFFLDSGRILIAIMQRRYDEAVSIGRAASEINPSMTSTLKMYLSALGHAGLDGEAGTVKARLLRLEPDFTITRLLERSPFETEWDRKHYADGLRATGIPET